MKNVTVTASTDKFCGKWVLRVDGVVRTESFDLYAIMREATKWGFHD
jgi:hypothetical protein